MRLAFWFLLLSNLALLAWSAGGFSASGEGREPERLARQIQPEKLRIVTEAVRRDEKTGSAPPIACARIAGLTPAETDSLQRALIGRAGWHLTLVAETPAPQYWIAFIGLPNRAAAEKKRDEARALGIEDPQIVDHETHGPFAVSLATLASEAAANERMQTLQRKGIRSARLIPLPQPPRSIVELRAPAQSLTQKLPDLATLFPSASIGNCETP